MKKALSQNQSECNFMAIVRVGFMLQKYFLREKFLMLYKLVCFSSIEMSITECACHHATLVRDYAETLAEETNAQTQT